MSGLSNTKQEFLNEIVDVMLQQLRYFLWNQNLEQLQMNDFEKSVHKLCLVFKISECLFRNLATVYRAGDATCSCSRTIYTVCCQLGFSHLELLVGKFETFIFNFGHTGCLSARMKGNVFHAEFTVDALNVVERLDFIMLQDFNEIEIKITGFGYLNDIFSKLSTLVLSFFKDRIHIVMDENMSAFLPLKMKF